MEFDLLCFDNGSVLIIFDEAELATASVFEAIEEEDQVIENNEGLSPALLSSCSDRARDLHASPSVGAYGEADVLYRAMPEMDLTPDTVTYSTLIERCCKTDRNIRLSTLRKNVIW
ncbi:unnamed protein product [Arabis nemorensis]|uniref:Uncharacterized protein n=1 Tax=Arabis nemorensis TaxID=586526 RepID=A0A565CM47_9BRAS|nr:unnamed protein product [Arabis nemorensis]